MANAKGFKNADPLNKVNPASVKAIVRKFQLAYPGRDEAEILNALRQIAGADLQLR
jgi:hypothetical protein